MGAGRQTRMLMMSMGLDGRITQGHADDPYKGSLTLLSHTEKR
jgi:hypothetical protein